MVDNKCQNWYKECADYTPDDFDDDTCIKISPSNKKIVKWQILIMEKNAKKQTRIAKIF